MKKLRMIADEGEDLGHVVMDLKSNAKMKKFCPEVLLWSIFCSEIQNLESES